jgi:DNA excision repair protein ERCC-2
MEAPKAVPVASPPARVPWPFDDIRRGQKEFLDDARRALADGAHLLAHAPTGIGKTAVALVASIEIALDRGKLVVFLTSRQSQHRIVIETLRRLAARGVRVASVDLIAKRAMCLQPAAPLGGRAFQAFCDGKVRTRTCSFFTRSADAVVAAALQRPLHVQELVEAGRACGVCPHKVAMEALPLAHVVVCDYNYVFSDIRAPFLARLERALSDLVLVVDEAHNLPDRIRSHLCGDLSVQDLARAAAEARGVDAETALGLLALMRSVGRRLATTRGERIARKEEFVDAVTEALRRPIGVAPGYDDFAEMVAWAGEEAVRLGRTTNLPDVAGFLRTWPTGDGAILRLVRPGAHGAFAYRLLDPSVLSRATFEGVHGSLLMSGTLHPPEMYADLLGIEPARRRMRTYASPFPRENRLLVAHPHVTTLYTRRGEAMFTAIADEVRSIAAAIPGNVAAFFPSYELLLECLDRLDWGGPKRLLVERPDWDKARRDAAVQALRLARLDGGALLLGVQGGSLSEGVDYEGNLLAAVIVVGLPLSPPSVEVEALKDYYARKFGPERGYDYAYVFPAVNKVLQAAGRPIRSERDRAAIVLLESRLVGPRYARYLPADFRPRTSEDPSMDAEAFVRSGGTDADERTNALVAR